jgi:UDP-N-acetylmuramate dehydrogenase
MILKENYSIKNSLQINSVADYGAEVNNLHDLDKLFIFINDKRLNYFILGEGTNLIPPSRYKGLAISYISDEILELDENTLRVGSSVNWHELVMYAINKNYFGFENLSLIPGSVGAAPIQNIGAYGADVQQLIMNVHYYDLDKGIHNTFNNAQCNFEYRNSIFKESNFLITHVDFKIKKNGELNLKYKSLSHEVNKKLQSGQQLSPKEVSNIVSKIRMKVLPDPNKEPNAGSFFKNPIVKPSDINLSSFNLDDLILWKIDKNYSKVGAARLIELIKHSLNKYDNVSISSKHNLVLTTNGNASQQEVLKLASEIQSKVKTTFNIDLEIEPRIIL